MADFLIVDANSVGYAHHRAKKLSVGGFETQAIIGLLASMREKLLAHRDSRMVICWDSGKSWRHEVYGEYKATRTKSKKQRAEKESYKKQRPFMATFLKHLGIEQVSAKGYEADDIAAMYAKRLSRRGKSVHLITSDKDWLQLVSDNVTWENGSDLIVTPENFRDVTGYDTVEQFVQVKALTGDTSDNIKGVGGIGGVNARKLINAFGTVPDFLDLCATRPDEICNLPKPWAALADPTSDTHRRYFENMRLVNLLGDESDPKQVDVTKGTWNPDEVFHLAQRLMFVSVYQNFENWMQPFYQYQLRRHTQ